MQSTGGSLTSLIESGRCELVKAISIEHCRSMERVPTKQFYGLGQPVRAFDSALAAQCLLLFLQPDFAPRAPCDPGHALVAIRNQQVCSN
jgi:hypothetical protein